MMKLLRSPPFNLAASAAVAAAVTGLAYDHLGFLGVALVGLLILFVSVQSELQKDGMRRPFVAERTSRLERLAREAEGDEMARFWRLARILGAILTAIGLTGFAVLQLPS